MVRTHLRRCLLAAALAPLAGLAVPAAVSIAAQSPVAAAPAATAASPVAFWRFPVDDPFTSSSWQ